MQALKGKSIILVTGMTTPELTYLLDSVSAVITDEGGITCHAATICREKEIPCLINSRIGTKIFSTGDFIAFEDNKVSLLKRNNTQLNIQPTNLLKSNQLSRSCVEAKQGLSIERPLGKPKIYTLDNPLLSKEGNIGNKAKRLGELYQLNYKVPPGIVLFSSNKIKWNKLFANELFGIIRNSFPENKIFSVRSSSPDEDGINKSLAGFYSTLLFQSIHTLIDAIIEVSEDMHKRGAPALCVIVQPMIDVRASGVIYSPNYPSGRLDQILVEIDTGAGGVVDGNAKPQRYICCRITGVVERIDLGAINEPSSYVEYPKKVTSLEALLCPNELEQIVELIHQLEKDFLFFLDIEFAFTNSGELYILQIRPLVH